MSGRVNLREQGFAYVATGPAYLEEARRSAESLRRHHPDVPICLISDRPPAEKGPFTEIRRPAGVVRHTPMDKVLAYEAPYEQILFLDTDTHVCGGLMPIFQLLERFDVAAVQDVNRGWNYELPGLPMTFSEFNTGVIAFRKSPKMEEFFGEWARAYDELRKSHGLINDQPAFRQTLFRSDLRVSPLPNEFHFLGDFPNSTLWKVRLIHARGNAERIERQVNEALGLRAYVPEMGVWNKFCGKRSLLTNLGRFFWCSLKILFQGAEDVTGKHPSRWWQNEPTEPGKK